MIWVDTIAELRKIVSGWRREGLTIGLVPTMGYFHEGHLSLMRHAKAENDRVVVSLFVNPTQFGPNEDLDRYPRDHARDRSLAEGVGVDLIFAPLPGEMYPEGFQTWVEVTGLTQGLCGKKSAGAFSRRDDGRDQAHDAGGTGQGLFWGERRPAVKGGAPDGPGFEHSRGGAARSPGA